MDNATLGWGIVSVLLALPMVYYVYRARKVYKDPETLRTPPILKLLGSLLLVVLSGLLYSIHTSSLLWLPALRIVMIHYALLLAYSGNYWLATKTYHHLVGSTLFLVTSTLSLTTLFLSYMAHNSSDILITDVPFNPTPLVYAWSFLALFVEAYLEVLILQLFWQTLYQSKDLTYRVRRGMGFIAYLAALSVTGLASLNLLLYMRYNDIYRHTINSLFFSIIPLVAFIPISNVIPHAWLLALVKPLQRRREQQAAQQMELLHYLHSRVLQITPQVRYPRPGFAQLRPEIEIGDAREVILSQAEYVVPLTPKQEAEHLFKLLHTNTILTSAGEHEPPIGPEDDTVKHYYLIAKHLQQLEGSKVS